MQAEAAIAQHRLFYHPVPQYPYEAHRDFVTGSGVFELRFDYETGYLREVHVASGTGSAFLDSAAIGTLKRWQAKPRSVHKITVPVTFFR
jgi:TonB family protein